MNVVSNKMKTCIIWFLNIYIIAIYFYQCYLLKPYNYEDIYFAIYLFLTFNCLDIEYQLFKKEVNSKMKRIEYVKNRTKYLVEYPKYIGVSVVVALALTTICLIWAILST